MKIGFIHDVLYPYVTGGAEHRAFELFSRLAKKHEVHIFTMHWEGMPSWNFKHHGINVHCVCKAPKKEAFYTKGRRSILPALKFSALLLPKLLKYDLDVLDCDEFPFLHLLPAKIYAIIKRIPLFITFHEYWTYKYWRAYAGPLFGTLGFIIQSLSKHLGNIICVSKKTRNLVKKGTIIPNGLNIKLIKSIKTKRAPNTILTASRLIPEKNVDKLIKAFNKLNKGKLTIIGEGPELKYLKSIAGQNVKFLGFLKSHKTVLKHMKSSHVYASMSEREGFGMSLLEAKACGCVTLDISDFKNKDPAKVLKQAFKRKPKKIQLKKHDWDLISKKLLNLYKHFSKHEGQHKIFKQSRF